MSSTYGLLPCRQCGNPVTGVKYTGDISFCCSRPPCIKKDDASGMTNRDKPLKKISEERWKRQLYLDSRGY